MKLLLEDLEKILLYLKKIF